MSVELLDKTRKINKLLHNSNSTKVVFNDICEVLGETLCSNVLVISRRGKILGMEPIEGGGQKLVATAPQAELFDYALALRSMTQGRGHFEMSFERYDELPKILADKVIANYQAEQNK